MRSSSSSIGVAGAQRIVGAHPVLPAGEGRVVAAVGLVGDERRPAHQRLLDLGRQPQAEEVDQRQVDRDEEGVLGGVDHLVRQPAPEDAEIAGAELGDMALHPVGHGAAEDVVDLDLGVPVRRRHDARLLVADHQAVRAPARPCSSAGSSGACRRSYHSTSSSSQCGGRGPEVRYCRDSPEDGQQQGRNEHAPSPSLRSIGARPGRRAGGAPKPSRARSRSGAGTSPPRRSRR